MEKIVYKKIVKMESNIFGTCSTYVLNSRQYLHAQIIVFFPSKPKGGFKGCSLFSELQNLKYGIWLFLIFLAYHIQLFTTTFGGCIWTNYFWVSTNMG